MEDYHLASLQSLDQDEAFARSLQEEEFKMHKPTVKLSELPPDDNLDDFKLAALLKLQETERYSASTTATESDPNPDLHTLFLNYNTLFFQSKLSHIEVKWSKRMTICAGLCYYFPGGYCSVRLSEPLLKFRPRSDFINTLLHELIHAYLFVTSDVRDRDGHGPQFLELADRINRMSGSKITVFHTFHDEVDHYRTHIWQCNGPCKDQAPYFGTVKRSMNRPPQPADKWFAMHQSNCKPEKKPNDKKMKVVDGKHTIKGKRKLLDANGKSYEKTVSDTQPSLDKFLKRFQGQGHILGTSVIDDKLIKRHRYKPEVDLHDQIGNVIEATVDSSTKSQLLNSEIVVISSEDEKNN